MAEQQEFCLRWNDFHSNFHLSLEALRGDESFTDVTLSCSGRLMKAHRVILSACSVHFKEILRGIPPQQHPVIVLPTVDYDVMQAIMEFIYQGQVNVKQSQLGAFLQVAETFSIQGLADDETKKNANKTPGRPRPPDSEPPAAKRRRPEPSLPRPGSPAAAAPPPASTAAAGSAAETPVRAQPTADSEKTVNISVSIKAEGMADTMVGELLEHSQPGGQMMDPDMEAAGSDVVAQAMATMGHESADTSASAAAPAVLSDIWEHFWTVGEHEALCRTCHCTIRYHRSSISNLKRHLVRRHPESFASAASASATATAAATAADAPATAPAAATAPAFSWPWPAAEGKSESGWPPESV